MPVTSIASAARERREAPTDVRFTPKAPAGSQARTPQTVFVAAAANSAPMHDLSMDAVSGVPSKGNCLYWAFGVLLGTYGTSTTQYKQLHLMPSGIRERLALRIRDVQHWSAHFLRVLELVRNILQRDPKGTNGPIPEAVQNAVNQITDYLRTTFNIPAGEYPIKMSDFESGRLTQGQAEAATDPPEDDELKVATAICKGRIPAERLAEMQLVVDTYVACSLNRDQNFADAFEVELLAEEFGVVIYYYTGDATSPVMIRKRDFYAAELTHIMYPSNAIKVAMASTDATVNRQAREEARVHGFHIVRLGQHFYYGMRRSKAAMARPWKAGSEAQAALMPGFVAPGAPDSAAYAAHNLAPGSITAHKRARLIAGRQRATVDAIASHAAAQTPGKKTQSENTAELYHVHMAALRRRDQGVAAQANPSNPSPGYDAFAMTSSGATAVAPPSSAAPGLLPRFAPPTTRWAAATPLQSPAWGTAGARLVRGYDATQYSIALAEKTFEQDRFKAVSVSSDDTIDVALDSITDPRDVLDTIMANDAITDCDACGQAGAVYDDADIELQLAAALAIINVGEFEGPVDD